MNKAKTLDTSQIRIRFELDRSQIVRQKSVLTQSSMQLSLEEMVAHISSVLTGPQNRLSTASRAATPKKCSRRLVRSEVLGLQRPRGDGPQMDPCDPVRPAETSRCYKPSFYCATTKMCFFSFFLFLFFFFFARTCLKGNPEKTKRKNLPNRRLKRTWTAETHPFSSSVSCLQFLF